MRPRLLVLMASAILLALWLQPVPAVRAATIVVNNATSCAAIGGTYSSSECRFYGSDSLNVATGDVLQVGMDITTSYLTNNGTIQITAGNSIWTFFDATNNGTITVSNGADLSNRQGTFTNNGTIFVACGASVSGTISGTQPLPPSTDCTGPTVAVNQATGQVDPATTSPVNFTAVFDESVTGFDSDDVVLSGTAGATTAVVTGSGTTYNIAVSGMTASGTVIASVRAGAVQDTATNPSSASTSTDNTLTFDNTPPTVTGVTSSNANGAYKIGGTISIQVGFTEAVTVVGTPQLTLETGTSDAVLNYGSGSGTATLTFDYTVRAGDTSDDLDYFSMGALALNGGTIRDAVGNNATRTLPTPGTAGSLGANKNLVIDGIAPPAPVVVTPANGAATSNTQPTISGTAEAYSTVTVVIDGTPLDPTTANGAGDWSRTLTTPLGNSAHTAKARVTDAAGNTGSDSNTNTFTVDTIAPNTTITANPPNPSTSTSASFSFTGNDSGGSGVASFACQLDSDSFSSCTSPQTFTGLADGSHTFQVRATDAAGNVDSSPASYTWTVDTAAPTVTINQAAGQADPANAGPLLFTVVFSEPVANFTADDVVLTGTAGATTATVAAAAPQNGTTYTVSVSGMTGSGTVTAAIPANAANDAAGNANTASTGADNTVTFDTIAPTVAITPVVPDPRNSAVASITIVFSEPIAGFDRADLHLTRDGGADLLTGAQTLTTSDDTTWTLGNLAGLTGAGGTYTLTLTATGSGIADPATNALAGAAPISWVTDTTLPTVALASTATDPTRTSPLPMTVTFSKAVNGFIATDITVGKGTVANFAGSGTAYTFDLVPTGQGVVTVGIAAGVATDSVGNGNIAAAPFSRTFDSVAPTVTVNQAAGQADPTVVGPIRFAVVFSEPVTGFAANDVALTGTVGGALTVTVTGSGTTYTVAVDGMTTGGTVIASVKPGAATDAAGNASAASTGADNTVTFQQQAALSVTANGPGTVSPGNGQYPFGPVTLTATANTGALFTGWRLDGRAIGWERTLTLNVTGPMAVTATFAARPRFSDVSAGPADEAIAQLAARGIVKGYGNGTFGPGDTVLRAQLAALIVRAMGWDTSDPRGPAPFSDLGGVDPELQRAIAILAQRGIINGYGDGTFGPTDEVKHAQVISFIARSMVQAGYWTAVTQDDPRLYPDVPLSSGHRLDLLTFVKYAGALPDRPANGNWADWTTPASRGWTAQVLWQALDSYFRTNHVP